MALSSTTIGLVALLIICLLLGYEFVEFDTTENVDQSSPLPRRNEIKKNILEISSRTSKIF
jgi:hypothetical protein